MGEEPQSRTVLSTSTPQANLTTLNPIKPVHPGITTLASCLIIAVLLGIYLSLGTIRRFIRAHRNDFAEDQEESRRSSNAETSEETRNKSPEVIQIKVIDGSVRSRSSTGQLSEGLPTYGNVVNPPAQDARYRATECSNKVVELLQLVKSTDSSTHFKKHSQGNFSKDVNNNPPLYSKLMIQEIQTATIGVK